MSESTVLWCRVLRYRAMSGTWDDLLEDDPDLGFIAHESDPWDTQAMQEALPVLPNKNINDVKKASTVPTPPPRVGTGRGRAFTSPAWMGTGKAASLHACNGLIMPLAA